MEKGTGGFLLARPRRWLLLHHGLAGPRLVRIIRVVGDFDVVRDQETFGWDGTVLFDPDCDRLAPDTGHLDRHLQREALPEPVLRVQFLDGPHVTEPSGE